MLPTLEKIPSRDEIVAKGLPQAAVIQLPPLKGYGAGCRIEQIRVDTDRFKGNTYAKLIDNRGICMIEATLEYILVRVHDEII